MTINIAYPAYFAATGGPGATLDTISVDPFDHAPISLAILGADEPLRFIAVDSQGQVFARSDSAVEIADWITEYAEALDKMNAEGEL